MIWKKQNDGDDMFDNAIVNILSNIWPMIVIFTVILSSYRLAYFIKYKEKFNFYDEVLKLGFIIYIMGLFYVVTFQDVSWSTSNLIPFKEMFRYEFGSYLFIKNVVGNMLMFLPYGFFVSYLLKLDKKSMILYLSIIVSLTIETTQLVIGRVFDVDDILLNICGGMCGYLLYRFICKIKDKLPNFFKNQVFYNIFVVFIVFGVIWYLYRIMMVGG